VLISDVFNYYPHVFKTLKSAVVLTHAKSPHTSAHVRRNERRYIITHTHNNDNDNNDNNNNSNNKEASNNNNNGEILLPGSVQILRLPLHPDRDDRILRDESIQFRRHHTKTHVRRVPSLGAGPAVGRGDEKDRRAEQDEK
jgi:hypothetical protein